MGIWFVGCVWLVELAAVEVDLSKYKKVGATFTTLTVNCNTNI